MRNGMEIKYRAPAMMVVLRRAFGAAMTGGLCLGGCEARSCVVEVVSCVALCVVYKMVRRN